VAPSIAAASISGSATAGIDERISANRQTF